MQKSDPQRSSIMAKLQENWQYIVMLALLILSIFFGMKLYYPFIPRDTGTRPANAQECRIGDSNGCISSTNDNVRLVFTEGPAEAAPYLLPLPKSDATLRALPKDGFDCFVSIGGNLAFYDKSGNLVTDFSAPVTLKIIYPIEAAKQSGCDIDPTGRNLAALYLYLPGSNKSVNIWKPFQSYHVSVEGSNFIIEVQFNGWGDDPFGIGTKKPPGT